MIELSSKLFKIIANFIASLSSNAIIAIRNHNHLIFFAIDASRTSIALVDVELAISFDNDITIMIDSDMLERIANTISTREKVYLYIASDQLTIEAKDDFTRRFTLLVLNENAHAITFDELLEKFQYICRVKTLSNVFVDAIKVLKKLKSDIAIVNITSNYVTFESNSYIRASVARKLEDKDCNELIEARYRREILEAYNEIAKNVNYITLKFDKYYRMLMMSEYDNARFALLVSSESL